LQPREEGDIMLNWNQEQTEIYELIQGGATYRQLKERGYKKPLVDKVKAAVSKGDVPHKQPENEKKPPAGEPLLSTTFKTQKVTLDPIVAVRYDSVRHALGWGDDYTLENFIDEATDIVANDLVGAVPPGFTREEEVEKDVDVVHVKAKAVIVGGD